MARGTMKLCAHAFHTQDDPNAVGIERCTVCHGNKHSPRLVREELAENPQGAEVMPIRDAPPAENFVEQAAHKMGHASAAEWVSKMIDYEAKRVNKDLPDSSTANDRLRKHMFTQYRALLEKRGFLPVKAAELAKVYVEAVERGEISE